MVAPAGIEPATRGFSVLCSTDWAMKPKKMAVPTGVEPAIFCVTGKRDNHYTTEPNGCGRWIWTNDLWVMSPASYRAAPSRDKQVAEEKGFEPLRRFHGLPVFKTGPFNQTWVFLHRWCLRSDLNRHEVWISQDFKSCASTYSATQASIQLLFCADEIIIY